ncbi:MAG: right-handed parallel beta-helix repeat-containing protein, partial [Bacteroidota bacterium]
VSFDTLLSQTRSTTLRLLVFNPNEDAIQFESIKLAKGESSDYDVIINGKAQDLVEGEQLLGGDSLLVLVEATINPQNENLPYLVRDSVVFSWNGNVEHVKLLAYGQDVTRRTREVVCTEVWTRDRPYLLSDTLVVDENCTLTIESGTTIFMSNDAALFVQGSLHMLGDSIDRITVRNQRLDGIFNEVPGQWNGIYFLEGSSNNKIEFTDIFNGQFGLRVGTPDEDVEPDVTIRNTSIANMSVAGILAFTSDVVASNTLIYNCGTYLVGNFAGGNYEYVHCTFSNWLSDFSHDEPSVQFSDNIVINEEGDLLTDDLSISLVNSIVWGGEQEELLINNGGDQQISSELVSNIIRSATPLVNNFTSLEINFPGFLDVSNDEYGLDSLANAVNAGAPSTIEIDILGQKRDVNPDIGAFERIETQ